MHRSCLGLLEQVLKFKNVSSKLQFIMRRNPKHLRNSTKKPLTSEHMKPNKNLQTQPTSSTSQIPMSRTSHGGIQARICSASTPLLSTATLASPPPDPPPENHSATKNFRKHEVKNGIHFNKQASSSTTLVVVFQRVSRFFDKNTHPPPNK